MKQYARWLAGYPGAELTGMRPGYRARHPMGAVRAAKASFFAHRTVQEQLVRQLEKRVDVREYFEKLRADTAYHAKELARDQIARNFEAREQGLEMAVKAEDHKAVEHYTRPFVEHGFPKKERDEAGVQKVVINLFGATPEQKAMVLKAMAGEPVEELEYEIIPNDKLLGDGSDD